MTRRLDLRLVLWLTVLILLINLVFVAINLKLREQELLRYMVESADQLSRSITSATWQAMLADHRQAAYEVMETIAAKQGIHRIRFFNKQGRVTFSTLPGDTQSVDMQAETCYVCHAKEKPLSKVAETSRIRIYPGSDGRRKLGMVTPIYNEPSCSEAACHAHPASRNVLGVLDLSLDLDSVDQDLAAAKRQVMLQAAAEIILITLVLIFFTWRFVRKPIHELVSATKHVSAMELDRPVQVTSRDELGELARSFEEMRQRLQSTIHDLNDLTQDLEHRVEERTDQLKTAHRKLMQSDRLTSLGQLAASVAHEINNPVGGILNLSMLMRRLMNEKEMTAERLEEFRRYLDQVISETSRVGRIVTDLLAFSRRPSPQHEPSDLNEVIRRTASLIYHKLQLLRVELDLNLDESLPSVSCDASQMQQVVINLISNGAEAMPDGGTVTVRTGLDPSRKSALLEVADSGVGVPKELQGRIFDPFFTTKEEGKGTGLGLAVTYGIVIAHKGEIEIDSEEGRGTVFKVILPLAGGPEAGQEPSRPGGPERVKWAV